MSGLEPILWTAVGKRAGAFHPPVERFLVLIGTNRAGR
jgi:hypothetical protein